MALMGGCASHVTGDAYGCSDSSDGSTGCTIDDHCVSGCEDLFAPTTSGDHADWGVYLLGATDCSTVSS